MKITPEEIRHVARLAHLDLGPGEVETMATQLDKILSYVDKLSELDTGGVAPTTHPHAARNAFREDEVKQSLERQEALGNAPQANAETFVVPRVI